MADTAHSAGIPARKVSVPTIKRGDSNRDAKLLAAFARWKDAHAVRVALPETGEMSQENPHTTVAEQAQWALIEQAELEILSLPATTPAGIASKLWLAVAHDATLRDPSDAGFRADLDYFVANTAGLDWNVLCIVSAIAALKSMEARP